MTPHLRQLLQGAAVTDPITQGTAALQIMEQHLKTQDFWVGGRYTVADLAPFAYIHLAPLASWI